MAQLQKESNKLEEAAAAAAHRDTRIAELEEQLHKERSDAAAAAANTKGKLSDAKNKFRQASASKDKTIAELEEKMKGMTEPCEWLVVGHCACFQPLC